MEDYSTEIVLTILGSGFLIFQIWFICRFIDLFNNVKKQNQILEDIRYNLEIPHTNFGIVSNYGGLIDEFGNEYFKILNIDITTNETYMRNFKGYITPDRIDRIHRYPIAIFNSRNVKIGTLPYGNENLYDLLQKEGRITGRGILGVNNGSMYCVNDYYGYFYLDSQKNTLKKETPKAQN